MLISFNDNLPSYGNEQRLYQLLQQFIRHFLIAYVKKENIYLSVDKRNTSHYVIPLVIDIIMVYIKDWFKGIHTLSRTIF